MVFRRGSLGVRYFARAYPPIRPTLYSIMFLNPIHAELVVIHFGGPFLMHVFSRVGKVMRASSRDLTPHVYYIASNK